MTERPRPIATRPGGVTFQEHFCLRCERDRAFWDGEGDGCPIAAAAIALEPGEDGWPAQVTKIGHGWTCTAFVPEGTRLPTDAELEAAGQLIIGEPGGET